MGVCERMRRCCAKNKADRESDASSNDVEERWRQALTTGVERKITANCATIAPRSQRCERCRNVAWDRSL